MAAVKKFYDTNDIELKWQKSSLMLIRERGGGRKDTIKEISKMLEKQISGEKLLFF